MTISLSVNGKARQLDAPTPLPDFLAQLKLGNRPIAIGYNGEVIHKDSWGEVTLQGNDVLDIVHMVGGG